MSTEPFRFCDELGPEKVIELYDAGTGLHAVLVVDNVAAGPAIGGVRMATDVTVEECFRLARAMTLKNAMAGLAHGGGKSVIKADPHSEPELIERLVRSFAFAIRDVRDYVPGPDMGTNESAMAIVKSVTGRAVGLPREVGGIPLDEIGATGFGLAVALQVAEQYADFHLRGARVVVQGFGSVGQHAARFLGERGARLVAVSDSGGARLHESGFELAELSELKRRGGSVVESAQGEPLDAERLLAVPCDVWIPAARPDVISEENVDQLDTKVIAEGANIPATPEAERRLAARGVLCIPDFVANAGGVICAAVEYHGGSESQALATIESKIRSNVAEVLAASAASGRPPRQEAEEIAAARVRRAMSYRKTW